MKQTNIMIIAAILIPAPALAQQESVEANPAQAVESGMQIGVETDYPENRSSGPNWKKINRKLNARAKNAIENGARPKVVRQKLQVHKQKLRRRWTASQ
ncbi:hypothetical protein GCM10009096_27750 [Parasphingorhabdus litoris]|uniref:DUF4148 domain-containing protein n=1 Tax=Parasphingorhabdus litoris TaxID=394733 RepID=A0ABN1AUN7_9SPHN|nr:hypothetical protein [Parasphingorhabdus litoris]